MWDGGSYHGYSKVNHSVPGVNMQDICTLQDRLAEMLPLDTDPRPVLLVFLYLGFWGIKEDDLRSVPELQHRQHITLWEDHGRTNNGGEKRRTTDWKNDTQSGRQAEGQTDGRTDREHS